MTSSINLRSQRISFVNKISLLQRALSDDEEPTPAYLYKDINDISYESVGYCESLVEFLLDRLRHKSCNVKLKVLKVMRHMLEHGSQEFLLGVRHHVAIVKEGTKFSGPPHPLHGNNPYIMVRRLTREVCETLYNINPVALRLGMKSSDVPSPPPAKYGGMGPSRSGGAIQGFGNSPVSHSKGFAGTILQEIEKLGTKLSETPADRQADRQAAVLAKLNLSASSSNYQPPVISPDNAQVVTTPESSKEVSPDLCLVQTLEDKAPVTRHLPGKAGGGWNDDEDDGNGDDVNDDSECTRLEHEEDGQVGGAYCLGSKNMAGSIEKQESDSEEKRLVESFTGPVQCQESCVEVPARISFLSNSDTADFLLQSSKMRRTMVVDCICFNLNQDDPLVSARSLQLLEAIVYSRQEVVNIECLAIQCKATLARCFTEAGRKSSHADGNSPYVHGKWKMVQTKTAKLILILQQLSQKEIYPTTALRQGLAVPNPIPVPS